MKSTDNSINLKIKNNTSLTQVINILGITTPYFYANVSDTIYEWDLSTEDFLAVTNVLISYNLVAPPFSLFLPNATFTNYSIQGVVDTLNSFGIGLFNYSGTTIYVSSSIYNFGKLVIS